MPISIRLFFLIYRFVFMPALVLLSLTVGLFSSKVRTGLADRMALRKVRKKLNAQPIWIHASSGEFEYAKSVIREIKDRQPTIPIVVTYFSPSYKKQINQFPGVDQAEPLPLDLLGPVSDFLRFYQPRLALFARTDLWPEILLQTKNLKIPSLLFSCTRPTLKKAGFLARPIYTVLYSLLDQIQCVSAFDQINLNAITPTQVAVAGDTRYDQVAFRLKQGRDFSTQILPTTMPRLIAGSTWAQDEDILLPAIASLVKAQKLQLILVPHEPTTSHLLKLTTQLQSLGLKSTLLSQTQNWTGHEVLIVDQIGVLADLYAYADFAFIGGSFKSRVHSVMEAIGAGLPVVVGPYFENNREATEFNKIKIGDQLNTLTALQSVKDIAQMTSALKILSALNGHERKQIKLQLEQEFTHRQGATQHVVAWLEHRLLKS